METESTAEPSVPDAEPSVPDAEPDVPGTEPSAPESEPPPPPPLPTRWSERAPARAAVVYALAYLALAGVGGEAVRFLHSPRVLMPLVTVVVLAATVLSLLLVLSVCRAPLRRGVHAVLLVVTTIVFLVCRPEVTLALAMWLRAPLLARVAMLPSFPGDTLLGNLALILWATAVGKGVSRIIREGNLLLPVALAASLADIITVFWGFVGQAAQTAPKVVAGLSAQAPMAETARQVSAPILTYIGIGDFLFLALFLSVALRHRMRAAAAMWAAFASMVVAAFFVNLSPYGIPGLPFISAGVLLVNRRCFHFTREEKRALAVVGALVVVLIGVGTVLLLRRHA